ncbi:MAG: hypothetical protein Q9159_007267 [Coniocarpon cinnabarinum]
MNNLNASDDTNHVGAIILEPMPQTSAADACAVLGESLISQGALQTHADDFARSLAYQTYAGYAAPNQAYFIQDGIVALGQSGDQLTFPTAPAGTKSLPILCTESSKADQPANSNATSTNTLSISSLGNSYVGYRNEKSFRFLGIPYADTPARFQYSHPYSPKGQTLQATTYGSQCAQASSGSEDCLFLNIQTPYLPRLGSKKSLRPVMFWIHGGGFTGGSGADPLSDGGNLASREDIVTVTINYRLSTLGFLAIPGTNITGNFGIGDQVTALKWTKDNIAAFGGDPERMTIVGESAGAGSVRTLLGSPPAIGQFQGAIAMSNLGGGVDLGLSGNYATTYSSYLTINGSYAIAGQNIFQAAGCNQTSLQAQIACLEQVPALSLVELSSVARYVVQDGTYVNTEQLIVSTNNASTAHVPVMFGNMHDDGASFITYPRMANVTDEATGIMAALGISRPYAQSIIDSGLFPYYDTGNLTLDSFNVSARVGTDNQFLCVDQATLYAGVTTGAFPSAYYYSMNRGIGGYDPNNVGKPPATPEYPNGDPHLPYFKVHAADMAWVFGNLRTEQIRDANDLYFAQLASGYWAEFVKSGQPRETGKTKLEAINIEDAGLGRALDQMGLAPRPSYLMAGCMLTLIIGAFKGVMGTHSAPQDIVPNAKTRQLGKLHYEKVDLTEVLQIEFAFELLYTIALGLIKLVLLFTYCRTFSGRAFNILNSILMTLVVGWMVSFFFADLLGCGDNVNANWTSPPNASAICVNAQSKALAKAAIDVLTNLWMAAMPVGFLRAHHLAYVPRISIGVTSILGALTLAMSVVGLAFQAQLRQVGAKGTVFGMDTSDALGIKGMYLYWQMVELGVSMAVCCLPSPLLRTGEFSRYLDEARGRSTSMSVTMSRKRSSSSDSWPGSEVFFAGPYKVEGATRSYASKVEMEA